MNTFSQGVGVRSMELIAEIHQPFNPFKTLLSGLLLKSFNPPDHRNGSIILFVEYDPDRRQLSILRVIYQ